MAATSSCSSYSTWTSTVRAFRSSSVVWARPSRRMRIIRSRTMGWIKRWAFLSAPAARAVKSGYQKSEYWNYTWSRAEATPRRHQPAPSSLVGKVRFTPIPVGSEYLPPRVGADRCVRPGTPPHGTRLRADTQVGPYDPPASSIDPGQRAGTPPRPYRAPGAAELPRHRGLLLRGPQVQFLAVPLGFDELPHAFFHGPGHHEVHLPIVRLALLRDLRWILLHNIISHIVYYKM